MLKEKLTKFFVLFGVILLVLIITIGSINFYFISYYPDSILCKKDYSESKCLQSWITYVRSDLAGDCYLNKIDEKGVSTEFHERLVDVYIVDPNFTNNQMVGVVDGANLIWKDYGIQFVKNDVLRIENKSLKPIFRNKEDYLKFGRDIVGEDKLHDSVIDVIFIEEIKPGLDGKLVDNTTLILVSTQSKNISWITAHEMGHVLHLYDKAYFSGEYNLMIRGGCIRDGYYPTVLNQKQVNDAVAAASEYERSQTK